MKNFSNIYIKKKIPFRWVRSIEYLNRQRQIKIEVEELVAENKIEPVEYLFKNFKKQLAEDCHNLLVRLWMEVRQQDEEMENSEGNSTETPDKDSEDSSEISCDDYNLTSSEWGLIRKGAKFFVFNPGEVIILENQTYQKIFFILGGSCKVMKKHPSGEDVFLGTITEVSLQTSQLNIFI